MTNDFTILTERMKAALPEGRRNDSALARLLGVTPQALSANRRELG